MKRIRQATQTLITNVRRHPLLAGLLMMSVVIIVGLIWFFIPKTVVFSYAERTCTDELTLLPGLHQQASDSTYAVNFHDQVEIAGVALLSRSVCFIPQDAPHQADLKVTTSLWGSWFMPQVYKLRVGPEPRVSTTTFERPVPITKPISVSLDQPDIIYNYELEVGKSTTECTSEQATLLCDIQQLNLDQGKSYPYKLIRQFDNATVQQVSEGKIQTLKAVRVTKSTIKKNQTVYNKPTKFNITFDKPIEQATVSLDGGKDPVDLNIEYDGKMATIQLSKQLQRDTKYKLILESVEASDGSTLVDPYEVPFMVSGGPKVTNVSIGASRVDPNARVVINFDQELSSTQNITSLISVKGGNNTVAKIGPRQVAVQLNGFGRCQPFTITVASGVLSKYDIKNSNSWSYKSRTTCYTTSVYGYSLQGRPLVAYYFGNSGPITLYTGAIHGNEISSKFMMDSWISELEGNPSKLGNRQVVVIPSINPDGVAAGTRNNSRDVNLSRNFPTDNWVEDINDTNGRNDGGGGKKPLSEPEAAALANLTQSLRPRLLVSYHAVGSLVVGDPGGFSASKASQYARLVGYRDATGDSGTFDYDITGSYEDWTYRNVGIPSMVIELGSYSYHSIDHHRAALWAMLD